MINSMSVCKLGSYIQMNMYYLSPLGWRQSVDYQKQEALIWDNTLQTTHHTARRSGMKTSFSFDVPHCCHYNKIVQRVSTKYKTYSTRSRVYSRVHDIVGFARNSKVVETQSSYTRGKRRNFVHNKRKVVYLIRQLFSCPW